MEDTVRREWQGKSTAVVGLGVSNVPLIRFLRRFGAAVSGRDKATREALGERARELEELGVELILGEGYLDGLEAYDVVFLSPGIPKNLPQLQALAGKVQFSSEIGLVMRYCRAPILGITGSSGKTTTTTLIGEMLRASGIETYVGGNIGTPLIEKVLDIPPQARVVLELSSFQLEQLTVSPQYALVTNFSENHLDVHGTMENYAAAKARIYRFQHSTDAAVVNGDDPAVLAMSAQTPARRYYFSRRREVERGTFLRDGLLLWRDEQGERAFARTSEVRLLGEHNLENLLAAAVMAHLGGASWEAIGQVCRTFTGVAHRLELVGEKNGVRYYNDSIATTPVRAVAGLRSFSGPVILLAGGYDKKLSFAPLAAEIHARAKAVVVFGETAQQIADAVQSVGEFPIYRAADLQEAVRIGESLAAPGDVVLLSPGCASYDMYRNFEERGAHFRRLVAELIKEG